MYFLGLFRRRSVPGTAVDQAPLGSRNHCSLTACGFRHPLVSLVRSCFGSKTRAFSLARLYLGMVRGCCSHQETNQAVEGTFSLVADAWDRAYTPFRREWCNCASEPLAAGAAYAFNGSIRTAVVGPFLDGEKLCECLDQLNCLSGTTRSIVDHIIWRSAFR